jgi:hypothetical protein
MPTPPNRFLALASITVGLLISPVSARQQAQKPAPATGFILGRVLEATTNEPVRDAIVQIATGAGDVDMMHHAPSPDTQPLGVMTDGDGQFVFTGLPGGSYRLWARRQGYQEAAYGARRPKDDAGEPLILRAGEQRGDIVVRLWKYAAIAGVVTDEFGDPVVHAAVRAYARAIVAGHARLGMNVAHGTTDDRGVYRLSRLTPGDYIVGVIRSERSAPAALVDARQKLEAEANRADAGKIGEALSGAGAFVAPPGTSDSVRFGSAFLGLVPPVAPAAADGWMTYTTQFHSGVPGPGAARAIAVRSGDEVAGIDFRLRPVRTRSISGTISDADGPVARFPVRLLPADATEFEMEGLSPSHATLTDDAGRFVFPAVPAGDYVVRALRGVGGGVEAWAGAGVEEVSGGVVISSGNFAVVTASEPPPARAEPTRYATMPVSVGDRDVANVALSLNRGAPLSGAVEFAGRSDRPTAAALRAIGIVVEAIDGRTTGFEFEMTGRVDAEGRFETVGLPAGRYYVRVPRVPPGWTLESVQFAGRDVSDIAIDVANTPISGLTIRLTQQPAMFAGSVRASTAKDDLGRAMVVIFPVDRARWRDYGSTPRRLRDAGLASDGGFEIQGLPPGEYFAAAIPDDYVRDWRMPSLLEALARVATRVTISSGGRAPHMLTLTAVPGGR